VVVTTGGNSQPRKRGRPMKAARTSGGVPESPAQSTMPHPSHNAPPQTPIQQTASLPAQGGNVTPGQASPPKSTPSKSVVKALPTVRDHTTDQLGPDGDEYIPREYDEAGDRKIAPNGALLDKREYKCRTFFVPGRGDKLFMLATECARILNYRDSYLLFNKNRSLYKIIATQAEKEDLISQEILPFSYRSRQIAIVTARSMFRQFGSRVVENGRRVRDDYWESKARKQGFTEEDLAGEKRPGAAKARDQAAAEASASASAMLAHQGDVIYAQPSQYGAHGQPHSMHSGMMGLPGTGTPLPMITLAPDQNDMRLGDFRNMPRPRQEIQGPAYQDRTQPSPATELLTQAHHAAEYNKSVNQSRNVRSKYMESIWKQSHEPPATMLPPTNAPSDLLPPVTQSLQSPHGPGSLQQPILSSQAAQMMTPGPYSQGPHSQTTAQSPMRMSQGMMRPDTLSGRSPSLSQPSGSGGMNQPGNPYAPYPQNPVWNPPQPQQSPQPGYSAYSTHGAQPPSSHQQQSPHHSPSVLRQPSSGSQMPSGMQYGGMPGIPQSYSTPGRSMYPSDQSTQQYMSQSTPGQNPPQGWPPQHPPGPSGWGGWNQPQ
jgi:hypothetical protein